MPVVGGKGKSVSPKPYVMRRLLFEFGKPVFST